MKKLIALVFLTLMNTVSSAAVLTGDSIDFTVAPAGIFSTPPVVVGAGDDLVSIFYHFDFDAGPAGDQFLWSSIPSAGNLAGSNAITLSDLDFNDGSSLIGFDLFSTLLSGLTISVMPDSITFSHTSTDMVGPGTVLSGRFITTSTHQIPTPATAPLVLLAAGIALWRARAGKKGAGRSN